MNIGRAVDAIRKKFGNGALILLYHRIAHLERDPQLLAVTPERFDEHLEILRRKANVMPLKELVQKRDSGLPPRSVAITFDDGYADNLLFAKPLLERHELPATVFVTSGFVGVDREFWWDELDRILLNHQDAGWNVASGNDDEPRHAEYRSLHATLRSSTEPQRLQALHDLQVRTNSGSSARATHRALTPDQLRELAEGGLVEVGAHTVTHPVLASLSPASQHQEIDTSKRKLEEWLGQTVHSFAYPYGGKRDYDKHSVEAVRNLGFSLACSNFRGTVWPNTNRLELPRALIRNWGGEEFERMLDAEFA